MSVEFLHRRSVMFPLCNRACGDSVSPGGSGAAGPDGDIVSARETISKVKNCLCSASPSLPAETGADFPGF